jgi:dipeptidase E
VHAVKLYLSSYRLGDDPAALRRLVGAGSRAGVVMNACDGFDEPRMVWPRERADLEALGFDVVEIDLRDHVGDEAGLRDRLADLDLLWVTGGNTFVLTRAMDASSFAAAARPLVDDGSLVYAGYSAGVCAITPDLVGIHLMDEPDVVPDGYPETAEPLALGWVPWRIVPHWRSEHDESPAADLAVEHLLELGLPFRTLRDGRVIVVEE